MTDFDQSADKIATMMAKLTASQQAEVFTLLEELEEITEGRNGLTVCLAIGLLQCRTLQAERERIQSERN